MRETGSYQVIGKVRYFIPCNLPPKDPSFVLDEEILDLCSRTNFSLGKLNEIALRLPDIDRFVKAFIIKEAMLSSSIEDIHTSLLDIFTQLISGTKINKSTKLVCNYTQSVNTALDMLQKYNIPLSSRVILAAHNLLLNGESSAGQYRKQSVSVGELVPPPAVEIPKLLTQLEIYMNEEKGLPSIIKSGLVHLQFETIHPFLDGNGRIGRLLIVLMLIKDGLLNKPILYPSYYFKKHQLEYYQRLNAVRIQGDFEGWIKYYLRAIDTSSIYAYRKAKDIENLDFELQALIKSTAKFNKMRNTALLVLNTIFKYPISSIKDLSQNCQRSFNTINKIITYFLELNILQEDTGKKRNKSYHFIKYLNLLESD